MQTSIVVARWRVGADDAIAHQRTQAGHQLLDAERLGHVVVGAGVERFHLFLLGVAHGKHQHGHLGPLAQFGQHVVPLAIRQPDVQDHDIGVARRGERQAVGGVRGKQHVVALGTQADIEEFADLRFVIDD